MTAFALGPPSEDSPEFAAFLVAHSIVPRSEDEVDFLRHLLWYELLGGDSERLRDALGRHRAASAQRLNPR